MTSTYERQLMRAVAIGVLVIFILAAAIALLPSISAGHSLVPQCDEHSSWCKLTGVHSDPSEPPEPPEPPDLQPGPVDPHDPIEIDPPVEPNDPIEIDPPNPFEPPEPIPCYAERSHEFGFICKCCGNYNDLVDEWYSAWSGPIEKINEGITFKQHWGLVYPCNIFRRCECCGCLNWIVNP